MAALLAKLLRLDAKIREVYHDVEEEVEREEKFVQVLEQSLAVLQKLKLQGKRDKAESIRNRSRSIIGTGTVREQSSRVITYTNGLVSDESRFAQLTPRNYANPVANQSRSDLPQSSISGKLTHSGAQSKLPPRNPHLPVPKLPLGSRENATKVGMGSGPKAILLELEQVKFEKTFEKMQERFKGIQQDSESQFYHSTTVVTPFDVADRLRETSKPQRRLSSDKLVRNQFTSSTGGLNRRGSERFDRQNNSRNSSHSGSNYVNRNEMETFKSLSRLKQLGLKKLYSFDLGNQKNDAIQERSLESSGVAITNALHSLNRNASKNSSEMAKKASIGGFDRPAFSRKSEQDITSAQHERSANNIKSTPSVPLGTPAHGMSRNNSRAIYHGDRESDDRRLHGKGEIHVTERSPEQVASHKVSPRVRSIDVSSVPEQTNIVSQAFRGELFKSGNLDSTGGMIPNTMMRPQLAYTNASLGLEGSPIMAHRELESQNPAKRSAQATLVGLAGMLLRDSRQIRHDLSYSLEPNFVMQSFDPFSSKLASVSPVREYDTHTDKEQ